MGWFDWLFRRKQTTLDEGDIGTGAAAATWTATDDADDSGADADSGGSDSGGSDGGGFDGGGGSGSDGGSSG